MSARRVAARAFAIGAWVLVAAIVVQFLLAGLGIFYNPDFFFWHAVVNAAVLFFGALLLAGAGWLGGAPRRLIGLAAAVAGLVVVQSLLLVPYHMPAAGLLRAVAGVHVVNALVIFWAALRLLEQTRQWSYHPTRGD